MDQWVIARFRMTGNRPSTDDAPTLRLIPIFWPGPAWVLWWAVVQLHPRRFPLSCPHASLHNDLPIKAADLADPVQVLVDPQGRARQSAARPPSSWARAQAASADPARGPGKWGPATCAFLPDRTYADGGHREHRQAGAPCGPYAGWPAPHWLPMVGQGSVSALARNLARGRRRQAPPACGHGSGWRNTR